MYGRCEWRWTLEVGQPGPVSCGHEHGAPPGGLHLLFRARQPQGISRRPLAGIRFRPGERTGPVQDAKRMSRGETARHVNSRGLQPFCLPRSAFDPHHRATRSVSYRPLELEMERREWPIAVDQVRFVRISPFGRKRNKRNSWNELPKPDQAFLKSFHFCSCMW